MDETCFAESELYRKMQWRIHGLEQELEAHRSYKKSAGNQTLLAVEDIDLYPGEQLDFVLSVLEQIRERCPEESRSREIVDSILSVNRPVGKGKEILDELERLFKRGYPNTEADYRALNAIGFSYTPSRKHPKLRFHDRYTVVLPSTPSDSRRGALNCLSEISKCIAVRQKV